MANVTIIGGHGKVALLAEPMLRERKQSYDEVLGFYRSAVPHRR